MDKYRILEAYNRDKRPNRPNSSNNKQSSNNIIINEIQEMPPALGDLESIRRKARAMATKEDSLIKFVALLRGYYYDNNK
jgi:hypothetical protein